jgi:hypothetical protein
VIACVRSSNAAGLFHFWMRKKVRLIAVEAAGEGIKSGKSTHYQSLGTDGILHGSRGLVMQDTDGRIIEPHRGISVGLDYRVSVRFMPTFLSSGRVTFPMQPIVRLYWLFFNSQGWKVLYRLWNRRMHWLCLKKYGLIKKIMWLFV